MNNKFFKNWSTYANFILVLIPALLTLMVDLGVDGQTMATATAIGSAIVMVAQSIKQKEGA